MVLHLQFHAFHSPLGQILLEGSHCSIHGLQFLDSLELFPPSADYPLFLEAERQVTAYFRGELQEFSLPLTKNGTVFQQEVWRCLEGELPYGETWNYTQLAEKIGKPKAIRAVATACKANSLAILVPCHRILPKQGGIGGYNGGVWRKEFLLALERGSV